MLAWLTIAALVLMIGSFVVLAQFGGAPPGSTYVPAHIENGRLVPGTDAMTQRRGDRDSTTPPGSATAPLAARARRCSNGDGEEARVVGGAVRNALLGEPLGDIDIATTAVPEEVIAPRRAPPASRRCRPASSTAPSRWSSTACRSR